MSFIMYKNETKEKKLYNMNKKEKKTVPCVSLEKAKLKRTGEQNLRELAKKLAKREYDAKDNPARKRLEEKFKNI